MQILCIILCLVGTLPGMRSLVGKWLFDTQFNGTLNPKRPPQHEEVQIIIYLLHCASQRGRAGTLNTVSECVVSEQLHVCNLPTYLGAEERLPGLLHLQLPRLDFVSMLRMMMARWLSAQLKCRAGALHPVAIHRLLTGV